MDLFIQHSKAKIKTQDLEQLLDTIIVSDQLITINPNEEIKSYCKKNNINLIAAPLINESLIDGYENAIKNNPISNNILIAPDLSYLPKYQTMVKDKGLEVNFYNNKLEKISPQAPATTISNNNQESKKQNSEDKIISIKGIISSINPIPKYNGIQVEISQQEKINYSNKNNVHVIDIIKSAKPKTKTDDLIDHYYDRTLNNTSENHNVENILYDKKIKSIVKIEPNNPFDTDVVFIPSTQIINSKPNIFQKKLSETAQKIKNEKVILIENEKVYQGTITTYTKGLKTFEKSNELDKENYLPQIEYVETLNSKIDDYQNSINTIDIDTGENLESSLRYFKNTKASLEDKFYESQNTRYNENETSKRPIDQNPNFNSLAGHDYQSESDDRPTHKTIYKTIAIWNNKASAFQKDFNVGDEVTIITKKSNNKTTFLSAIKPQLIKNSFYIRKKNKTSNKSTEYQLISEQSNLIKNDNPIFYYSTKDYKVGQKILIEGSIDAFKSKNIIKAQKVLKKAQHER